jgi:hypothetical protein
MVSQGNALKYRQHCTPSLSAMRHSNKLIHLYNFLLCCYHPNEYPNVVVAG